MFATARTILARTAIAFAPTVALMLITAGVTPALARGQHGDGAAPSRIAPRDASQFDFFIGQWELVVKPAATTLAARIHGAPKLLGSWKAWRTLDGWGYLSTISPKSRDLASPNLDPAAIVFTS